MASKRQKILKKLAASYNTQKGMDRKHNAAQIEAGDQYLSTPYEMASVRALGNTIKLERKLERSHQGRWNLVDRDLKRLQHKTKDRKWDYNVGEPKSWKNKK